jgi:hypothetical protein
MANDTFDLRRFAEGMKPSKDVPNYNDLMKKMAPDFRKFSSGFRERVRAAKKKKARAQEVNENDIKVFVVIGTGGTFQSDETDEGRAPTGTLKDSFDALGLPEDPSVHLELCDLMKLDSSQMTVEQWRFLAEMITHLEKEASDMFDAIIITHGTDTMAKGASYLSLMLKGFPKSIIFTGSQEPARKTGSDAKDQMERSITTAKLASNRMRRITEVMVSCGLRVSRGTWAEKLGDQTVNAFGPWNQPNQDYDLTDWEKAARDGTLHRLAPALLDFGTGKSKGSLQFASHAIDFEHKGAFEPYTEILEPADLFPATLSDKSVRAIANHIIAQRVAVLTQLGSATADDRLVEVALEAARHGKIILFEAPFHDSTVEPGTYKAGSKVKELLPNIQRRLPILNTSPATFEAKSNYLIHRLGMIQKGKTDGLGITYEDEDLRRFYDQMEQNLVRELV